MRTKSVHTHTHTHTHIYIYIYIYIYIKIVNRLQTDDASFLLTLAFDKSQLDLESQNRKAISRQFIFLTDGSFFFLFFLFFFFLHPALIIPVQTTLDHLTPPTPLHVPWSTLRVRPHKSLLADFLFEKRILSRLGNLLLWPERDLSLKLFKTLN